MEAVEDMQSLGAFFADDLQIWFPHVGTNEGNLRCHFVAYGGEEPLKRFDRSFFAHPEQARDSEVDLIDQRQILVPFGVLNFVHPDRVDLAQSPMLQPEGDDVFHGIEDFFP